MTLCISTPEKHQIWVIKRQIKPFLSYFQGVAMATINRIFKYQTPHTKLISYTCIACNFTGFYHVKISNYTKNGRITLNLYMVTKEPRFHGNPKHFRGAPILNI